MRKSFILCLLFSLSLASYSFCQETVQKTYSMSAIGYTGTPDDLKKELLLNAKRLAVSEIFSELISSYTKVENFKLTKDEITSLSAGFVRVAGNPVYHNGENFREVCVTINAYSTEEDKNKLRPIKISKKESFANPNLTTEQLKKHTEEQAIISALIDYERKLEGREKNELLPLVHNIKYIERGFVSGTETYRVEFEGIIYSIEILGLIQKLYILDPTTNLEKYLEVTCNRLDYYFSREDNYMNEESFWPGGICFEGYKERGGRFWHEWGARRCQYQGQSWIYTHSGGSDAHQKNLDLIFPVNSNVSSFELTYRVPEPANASIKFRVLAYLGYGNVPPKVLHDWIDFITSGNKMVFPISNYVRNITIQINNKGDNVWDDVLFKPIIYIE